MTKSSSLYIALSWPSCVPTVTSTLTSKKGYSVSQLYLVLCKRCHCKSTVVPEVHCSATNNRIHRGVFSGLITLADTSVVEKRFASSFKIEDYPVEGSSILFRNVDIRRLGLHSTLVQQTVIWINARFIRTYKHLNKLWIFKYTKMRSHRRRTTLLTCEL